MEGTASKPTMSIKTRIGTIFYFFLGPTAGTLRLSMYMALTLERGLGLVNAWERVDGSFHRKFFLAVGSIGSRTASGL
jgi:hypothetical protein